MTPRRPKRSLDCALCGTPIPAEKISSSIYCSAICRQRTNKRKTNDRLKAKRLADKAKLVRNCIRCGSSLGPEKHITAFYCTRTCKIKGWIEAHPEVKADGHARRRARAAGAPSISRVDRIAIIARDRSRCHICGKHVRKSDITLDHLIPLALGGPHSAANLAVAHRTCNSRKWIYATNEQLRLVG